MSKDKETLIKEARETAEELIQKATKEADKAWYWFFAPRSWKERKLQSAREYLEEADSLIKSTRLYERVVTEEKIVSEQSASKKTRKVMWSLGKEYLLHTKESLKREGIEFVDVQPRVSKPFDNNLLLMNNLIDKLPAEESKPIVETFLKGLENEEILNYLGIESVMVDILTRETISVDMLRDRIDKIREEEQT